MLLTAQPGEGVILLSGDNSANQTAPDSARENVFQSVGRVINADGSGAFGSVVHIRGKYLLTARHVANRSHVTFDGLTLWERDTSFNPVTFGTIDLKLIKLIEDPDLPETALFSATSGDIPRQVSGGGRPRTEFTTGTLIGWGVGRDPNDPEGSTTWNWGANSTMAKRWGTNRIEGNIAITYSFGGIDYAYQAIETVLNVSNDPNEAAAAIYDSGSGLFIEHEGIWKLAGLTATVSESGSSTFTVLGGDSNFFVRINQYAADIEAAIPDTQTLPGWKIDWGLYGSDAQNDADSDQDGIPLLLEFALGGNPLQPDTRILPVERMKEEGDQTYLELVVTRPIGLKGIEYRAQTTTDLTDWPTDSTGIVNETPTPVDNGDGTETVVYRRSQSVEASERAFIRLSVSETQI